MSKAMPKEFEIRVTASPSGIVIFEGDRRIVDLDAGKVLSVINTISYLIDEDIPGMINKGDWNKNDYQIDIKCKVPFQPMLSTDRD